MIKPGQENPVENEQGFETADSWIARKEEELQELIIEIETQLSLDGISKGQKHNKDKEIELTFNAGAKAIILELEKRKRKAPVDVPKYEAFRLSIFTLREKFFKDWGVAVDKNEEVLNVGKMTLREVADYVLEKELVFWTGEHDGWTDENDRRVVDALVQRLWKDKDKISGLTKDAIPGEKRTDGSPHYFADLDVREIVSDLQILGLFGILNEKGAERKDDGVAEGRITQLESAMATLQISKERLNETTLAHPRTGLVLYEMLRRMKDQPALRDGKTPVLNEGKLPPGFGRAPVNDRIVQRGSTKIVLYGDRYKESFDESGNVTSREVVEYTPLEAGDTLIIDYSQTTDGFVRKALPDRVVERNGMDVLLVGDRLNKIVNKDGKEIGARWYDPDQALPTDTNLYQFDPRFSYETLASDTGKDTLKKYAAHLLSLIEEQRLEEKDAKDQSRVLDWSKIHFKELIGFKFPDPSDEKFGKGDIRRLEMYARYLFFCFPFLTNILAIRQERTQTPSHGFNNKDIPFVWIFNMLGFISHKSQRYANSDNAYYYMLKFFKPLREGAYGAGGEARRLNAVRDLIIKYDKVFSDDQDNVSVIPNMPYGSSVFHTALSMLSLAPGDTSALSGRAELYDGTILDGTPDKPVFLSLGGVRAPKRKEPYNFSLLYTSIRAWDTLTTGSLQSLPGNLTIASIAEGGGKDKSFISQKYGDNVGQAKMSDTRTREKDKIPSLKEFNHLKLAANLIWDTVQRIFREYPANSIEARIKLYEELEKGFRHTAEVGGLSAGDSAEVLTWVLDKMSKPDRDGKLYGKGVGGFAGMNPCLAYREATIDGKRGKEVFEYVEALWNYKHSDAEGKVTKPFPFKLVAGTSGTGYVAINKQFVKHAFDPDPEIEEYKGMLYGYKMEKGEKKKARLPEPIARINLDKHED